MAELMRVALFRMSDNMVFNATTTSTSQTFYSVFYGNINNTVLDLYCKHITFQVGLKLFQITAEGGESR